MIDIFIRFEKILDCRLMLNIIDVNKDLFKSKKRKIEDFFFLELEDMSFVKKFIKNNRVGLLILCLILFIFFFVGYIIILELEEIFVFCLKIDNM